MIESTQNGWNETETRRPVSAPNPDREVSAPGLTILWHPDPSRIGERAPLTPPAAGRPIELSRLAPLFLADAGKAPRPLADPYLSRRPFLLTGSEASTPADERRPADGLRLAGGAPGSLRVDGSPFEAPVDLPGDRLRRGVVLTLANRVVLLLAPVDPTTSPAQGPAGMLGASPPILRLRREIRRLARVDAPVLIRGASGTGKELVARGLHEEGNRRSGPFVAVNLAALPPTLAAAELFGSERGAYSGADRERPGLFEQAAGGTLFLDEIGETPTEVQALLLRVLETGRIRRVGGRAERAVDVRVVAATDKDLKAAVDGGGFLAPLAYRLGAFEVAVPPLIGRRQDLGILLRHFLAACLETLGAADRLAPPQGPDALPWLPAALVERLALSAWPGNVRQVRNVAHRIALAGCDRESVPEGIDFGFGSTEGSPFVLGSEVELVGTGRAPASGAGSDPDASPDPPTPAKAADLSDQRVREALRANRWKVGPTARQLGVARSSLYDRIDASPTLRRARDLSAADVSRALRRSDGELSRAAERLEVSKKALQERVRALGLEP